MTMAPDLSDSLTRLLWLTWPVWATFGLLLLGRVAWLLSARLRLARSGIRKIDRMDGQTFELYLAELFRRLGYQVERTRTSGDFGADLVASRDGERTVIQAKRSQSSVGVKAVQEAVAAKAYYGCERAMVVTNNLYTRQAEELAAANEVVLWNRGALIEASLASRRWRRQRPAAAEPEAAVPEAPPTEPAAGVSAYTCADCGGRVSGRDRQYCLASPRRFGGRVYCAEHQRGH